MLTKQEIMMRMGSDIKITPFDEKMVNPNSVNLRLGQQLLIYDRKYNIDKQLLPLDMKIDNPYKIIDIPLLEGYILQPGELYLGQTYEYTETHHLIPVLSGRSSIGRLGLSIHVTAGFGDVGFAGHWTLELFVIRPLRIYPMVPICQIYYHEATGFTEEYKGKYQGNKGVQSSQIWREFR